MVDLSKMTKWDMGKLFDFSVLPKQSTEASTYSLNSARILSYFLSFKSPTFIQLSSTVAPKRTASAVSKALTALDCWPNGNPIAAPTMISVPFNSSATIGVHS